MSSPDAEFFQAVIDDHRRRPRHRGPLPTANRVARRENPNCGDICTMQFRLDGDCIAEAAFTGAGCALSQAGASLACVALTGKTVAESRVLVADVERAVTTGDCGATLGEPAALSAVHGRPARHLCALLAWRAALDALDASATG